MRWQGRQGSGNVEDRRGIGGGGIAVGGGIIGVIVLLFNLFTGGDVDPSQIPGVGGGGQQTTQQSPEQKRADDQLAQFTSVVLRETETVWQKVLPEQAGMQYQDPRLVLFTNSVQSACGGASSATGPFYCPGDKKIYIDLAFYNDLNNLTRRKGGSGDCWVVC